MKWKGVYFYNYVKNFLKFEENKLLLKIVFYNMLIKIYIINDEYMYV